MRVCQEIYITESNKDTRVCILKYKVIPSKHINSKPYDVWPVVQKNKPNEPGDYIHSADCRNIWDLQPCHKYVISYQECCGNCSNYNQVKQVWNI